MREHPTRRSWLKRLLGGLFSLGAAGVAKAQVPPEVPPPAGPPVPSRPLSHAGTPIVLATTFVYDATGPLAPHPSHVTTLVYDSCGRKGV
jgi:hypothetical protein